MRLLRIFFRCAACTVLASAVGCGASTVTTTAEDNADEVKDTAADAPGGETPSDSDEPTATEDTAEGSSAEEKTFVIDVRSKEEWESGHVESAVHIPHTEIGDRIDEVTQDKDAKIVVYCAVGGRAGRAKAKLEELGYSNVENGGGFDDVKDRFK